MGNISINQILSENDSRRKLLNAPYDPIIGDSRDDSRFCFYQWSELFSLMVAQEHGRS